jgi:hypothetical protein
MESRGVIMNVLCEAVISYRCLGKVLLDVAQEQVIGAKVVTPVADAMRLINHKARQATTLI